VKFYFNFIKKYKLHKVGQKYSTMNVLRLILFLLCIGNISCGQTKKEKTKSEAIKLCTEASKLTKFSAERDSCIKALILLDRATQIDSNYYLGYMNKLIFLSSLKLLDKSVLAVTNLIRLEPNAHDIYILRGIFYEKMKDTISSRSDFTKSINICNKVLDTMKTNNKDYEFIMINKAVNLILLDRNNESDIFLKNFSNYQKESELKNITLSMIGLNKFELIDKYYSGRNSH
jgi:tetratricopeptide (TPR) repeat protein